MDMRKQRLWLFGALLGGAAALALPDRSALAEQAEVARPAEPMRGGARRELAGHSFIGTQLTRDPFCTTYFDNRTGAGVAEGQGPRYNLAGEQVGERDYSLAALAESVEFQLGILPWLAFRVGGNGTVYSGTSAASVLGIGASAGYEGQLGVTAARPIGERLRVGAYFDYIHSRRFVFDVLGGVGQSLRDRAVAESTFLQESKGPLLAPGVTAALGLHPALGLVGSVQYRYDTESDALIGTDRNTLSEAIAADLDFGKLIGLPLGILAAYRATQPLGGDDTTWAHALDLGFFYTGRRDLDLGLQAGGRRFPGKRDRTFDAAIGVFVMRYYWQ
jgi:hypothetical protein